MHDIAEVEVFSSDPDQGDLADDEIVARISAKYYDCYIFLQTEYLAERLRPLIAGRFILIPMYDGARSRPDEFWRQFANAQFLSFCRAHHEHLEDLDCRSASFQFYPSPKPRPQRDFADASAFFWERRPDKEVNLPLVLDLCRQLGIHSLHIHAAPDFERLSRKLAPQDEMKIGGVSIVRTAWFEDRAEYEAAAGAPLYFFAPRSEEGIGMSILEAMRGGQIVVAADRPTANEYISHGTSGLLYDPASPKIASRLTASACEQVSLAAHRKIEFGYADWFADLERLRSVVLDDGRRWSTRDVSSHFVNALRRSASRRAFDIDAVDRTATVP